MGNEARHHHYIPQCYLRAFSSPGKGKHPQVVVNNTRHHTQFSANPRNIGGARDFNRINLEGVAPNEVENGYAKFEGLLGESLARIRSTNTFDGEDRLRVLNLIGLLAVRSPQMREHWRKQHETLIKHVMSVVLSRKEIWEAEVGRVDELRNGSPVSYEDMKDFYDRDQYSIQLGRDYHIGMELDMLDTVLPLVVQRKWTMYVSPDDNGQFVTSDRPVLLQYRDPANVPVMFRHSPGYGMPDTEIIFPLSRNHALVGEFDGDDDVVLAPPELVGVINTVMCATAYENFYSASRTILYKGSDRKLYRDSQIFRRLFE